MGGSKSRATSVFFDLQQEIIKAAVRVCDGNRAGAARALGVSVRTIRNYLNTKDTIETPSIVMAEEESANKAEFEEVLRSIRARSANSLQMLDYRLNALKVKPIVATVKVGDKYGPEYVNALYHAVQENTTIPFDFVCLTDDPIDLHCPHRPIETNLPGWWAKLILFRPHSALRYRRIIFLDLDTIITGNIDFLLKYSGKFAILRDFYRPTTYGSAIMSMIPEHMHVWDNFTKDIMLSMAGDQDWIYRQMPAADLWQDLYPGKIGSYKADCLVNGSKDYSIVCFHGEPKPHNAGGWAQELWEKAHKCG